MVLLLLDAGWIGAIASTAALALTAILFLMTRKRKSLSYEIVATYPLISIDDEIRGRLQILLDKEPVENVHLLLLRFVNDGNVPIAASEYERPLAVKFQPKSNILSAEHVGARPFDLAPPVKIEDSNVIFEPVLMNGGDSFTTKVLIGQYSGGFDVDARILGVKRVQLAPKRDRRERLSLIGNVAIAIACVIALGGAGYYIYHWLFPVRTISPRQYRPLTIEGLGASQYIVPGHDTITVKANVSGGDYDVYDYETAREYRKMIRYEWSARRGMVITTPDDAVAEYYAPLENGSDTVTLKITDKNGNTLTKSIDLQVVEARSYKVIPNKTP